MSGVILRKGIKAEDDANSGRVELGDIWDGPEDGRARGQKAVRAVVARGLDRSIIA